MASDQTSVREESYAELVVKVGAAVVPGTIVHLRCEYEHARLARRIVEHAYAAGARRVLLDYEDPHARLSALTHAPEDALREAAGWELARAREFEAQGAALIRLTGSSDPHMFDGIDPGRMAAVPIELAGEMRRILLSGNVTWTIVAAPNAGWAEQIFGEPDLERLWDAVSLAMRLDAPDVVAAWDDHRRSLEGRAAALDVLDLDAVRYHGPGTDLTVGLIAGSGWTGGGLRTNDGRAYMPNLPTEEVFTTPDRTRADGVITLTRPLVMSRAGTVVEGLVVHFRDGAITEVEADSGADVVRAELATDAGANRLGEVSLVDEGSRVRAAGLVFHDTLYDENAGCHVAWGSGFPFSIPGGMSLASADLVARGINQSVVHTDVVIGGPQVSVDGLCSDGSVVPIVADDRWVLPV
jgi:aminopeptidase